MRELARIGSKLINPAAESLAERLRSVEPEAGGEVPETTVPAFTFIDRFGGDIGSYAETACNVTEEKVDPSKHKDIYEVPKSFEEAWNHSDPFQREQWRGAIDKEFSKMEEKGVWKKINRSEMEEGRRCVKHRWALEIK